MTTGSRPRAGALRFAPHVVAVAFGLGLVSSVVQGTPTGVAVTGLAVSAAVFAFGIHRDPRIAFGGLVVGVAVIGAAWGTFRVDRTSWRPVQRTTVVHGIFVVEETVQRRDDRDGRITASASGVITGPDGHVVLRAGDHVIVQGASARLRPLALGQLVRLDGPVGPPAKPDDPGWWRDHLARRGIVGQMRSPGIRTIGRRGGLTGIRDRARERLRRTAVLGLSGDRAAVVRGMALGGGQSMSRETIDRMRAAGIWHLMAVSGQNIALVAVAVGALLGAMRVPRRGAAITSVGAVIGYCLVCDGGASVARAGIMGVLVVVARLASRATERWYLLIVGLDALLVVQPRAIDDPGLQLSFAAVVGLLSLAAPLTVWLAGFMPAGVADVAAQSVAASLATAPVSILRFEDYSLVGLVANIVAVPVAGPTVVTAMTGALLGALYQPLGVPLTWAAGIGADVVRATASVAAAIPGATVAPGVLGVAVAALVAMVVPVAARRLWRLDGRTSPWRSSRAHRRWAVIAAGCVLVTGALIWRSTRLRVTPWPEQPEVAVVDVGQGDAILLRSPDGHAALIDTGPPGDPAPVVRVLRRLGVRRLDVVALTHDQRDHDGALTEVARHVEVASVATAQPAVRGIAQVLGRPLQGLVRGQRVTVGDWRLDVLWPPGELRAEDPNDASLVLAAHAPGISALLTGDAEANILRRLPPDHVDVLKVSHHGSDDPGLSRVLATLRPSVAVISVGTGNEYGHPTPATIATLKSAGVPVWRTDDDGTVRVSVSDGGIRVTPDG